MLFLVALAWPDIARNLSAAYRVADYEDRGLDADSAAAQAVDDANREYRRPWQVQWRIYVLYAALGAGFLFLVGPPALNGPTHTKIGAVEAGAMPELPEVLPSPSEG